MGDMSATVLAVGRIAAEGGGSNFLVPNGTFFAVLLIFLIVLGVLSTFVVPPIMQVLSAREYLVAKTQDDNKKSEEQLAAAQADYEQLLSDARGEASGAREEARTEGRKLLDEARGRVEEEVRSTLQDANDRLKREGDAIAEELRSHVETASASLAGRILGVDISKSAAASGAKKE
jgi:F-type H+-transporting ATPase subunit b